VIGYDQSGKVAETWEPSFKSAADLNSYLRYLETPFGPDPHWKERRDQMWEIICWDGVKLSRYS
jgi:hypothetical protein